MKVLSWNVNGLTEDKLQDDDFLNLISGYDVIFLYESWTREDSKIEIPGYSSYNFYRTFQHGRARRCSGGVVVYIRQHYQDSIELVKNSHDTIIWLKLDRTFFRVQSDIFLCGVYLWGEGSPAYNHVDADFFDILETDISHFSESGSVFLCGDFNSRVGLRNDFIDHDRATLLDDFYYVPDTFFRRNSCDHKCNNFGMKLLDLCKTTGMRIANGRIGETDMFTFVTRQGASVIDYVLCCENELYNISNFEIKSLNEWSDHAPIIFSLNSNHVNPNKEDEFTYKYKWSSKNRDAFRSALIGQLPLLYQLTSNLSSTPQSINSTIIRFSDVIRSVADEYCLKCYNENTLHDNSTSDCRRNAMWFDSDCRNARKEYLDALKVFNHSKSDTNRLLLCDRKHLYKQLIQKKKAQFKLKRVREIENLRMKSPRTFWKYFKPSNFKSENTIPIEDFYDYFAHLEEEIFTCKNDEAEEFCNTHNFDDFNVHEELDCPITAEEILKAVKKLKTNKAYGNDCLLNEYFIETIDIIQPFLCDIFNAIFNSGIFPDSWRKGLIIPLHKKGARNDVRNYRGITLLSCLSKLFTSIINERLVSFCDKNKLISDAQFGFKKGTSTIDAIFALNTLVEHYLCHNKRLYVGFIDLKKCFDSIYRNALWYKLFNAGISGKVLRLLKHMYSEVKSCVKHCRTFSDFFDISVGVRQGEIMSPVLVSLFLNDLESYLKDANNTGVTVESLVLIMLLFADDMAILGNSPNELQHHIDQLHVYCQKWGIEVNSSKTKVMVFRKRGGIKQEEKWSYDGANLEVVDTFNYLGNVFSYNGNFSHHYEYISGKSLKALNALLYNCKRLPLKPKILCQLFDSFVGGILNYGCEVWGNNKSKKLERVQLKFYKRLLKVPWNCSNSAVYGELARYPLFVVRFGRIIKFWCKIALSDNIILNNIYGLALRDCNLGKRNWLADVKSMLDNYGFSEVFHNLNHQSALSFPHVFKRRVFDCFQQEWLGEIGRNRILEDYRLFKINFEYENYLDLVPFSLRFFITRLRVSSHRLRIHTGRFDGTPRHERLCIFCNMDDIEDIYHFICICPSYTQLRYKYIDRKILYKTLCF